ncbi:MAG: glutamine amidotransferase [Gemmatales bacterium]|nr:glutamine amidotransferase [Gemmatales bacterium]MDW8385477.1 glutamine amidotransferase [Gemmatales bacterium]
MTNADWLPNLDPLWPLVAISSAAVLIIVLTLWGYRSLTNFRASRITALIVIRLAALAVACLVLLRPTWDYREVKRNPGTLIVLFDASKSMLVKDEDPGMTRWKAALLDWKSAGEMLQRLESEQLLRVITHRFDDQLREMDFDRDADGDRTALLKALNDAYEHHKPLERDAAGQLLGIVVFSDGRENVGKPPMESVISRLSRAPCPVHVIALGAPGGSELQPDLAAVHIEAPQTARVKDRIIVRGTLQAQRFVGQDVEVWLRINDQPVDQADHPGSPVRLVLRPTTAVQTFQVEMPAGKLPDQPGDVRVSLWIKPLAGELTETNNEVSTYVTLVKEGLSILYIDKDRWEPKFLRRALKGDERITLYSAYLGQDTGPEADAWRRDLLRALQSGERPYDVYILGDIPASRFVPRTPEGQAILQRIHDQVNDGAGLLMIGGHQSFANGVDGRGTGSWRGTIIETLLPVELDSIGQLEGEGGHRSVRFVPTEAGLRHFALRLDSDPVRNRQWWERLRPLDGANRLGTRKRGATELAMTPEGDLLLAVQEYGRGRTAALAVDTTWRWVRPGPPRNPEDRDRPGVLSESSEAHLRFWRQLILWLARQEEAGKSLRVELDHRRLAAGKEQGITVQAREVNPGGDRDRQRVIKDAEFTVRIRRPNQPEDAAPDTLAVLPEGPDGKHRGVYWNTDEPGEYVVEVSARHQGNDLGSTTVRFMTYRDDSELLNQAANHTLLEQIARATGGSFRVHGGLRNLLEEINPAAAAESVKITRLPDWKQANPGLMTLLFALFVALLSAEWVLRRLWGLV